MSDNTWDSGLGVITETVRRPDPNGKWALFDRAVFKPKTYATHSNACRYGHTRNASPIQMLDGSERWTPLPFFRPCGNINSYRETNQEPS